MDNIQNEKNHHENSLNDELRMMVNSYLDQHPHLSLNALAQRSGVPATSMRRLMQGENKSEMAPHSVLSLVSYLLKEKKISRLLKIVTGPVAELLNKCFDQFIFDEESSPHKLDQDLNHVLRDKNSYLIYKLAANHCGTTIDEVKEALGTHGLKKLDELIATQWIIPDESGIRLHAKEKNFSLNLSLAHQLSHALLDQYKVSDIELGHNLFYSLSEGLTESAIKKIKDIEKDAVKKIHAVMNEQNNFGTIPYFAIILSEVIGPTPRPTNQYSNQTGALQ